MSWLENEEKNFHKNLNDVQNFHSNLQTVINVCKRINQILRFPHDLREELKENKYEVGIRDSEDDRYRVGDDLHINSYKRFLKISHSPNSNLIELIREKTSVIKINRYDDDNSTWEKSDGVYPSTFHFKQLSDQQLKNIDESAWVEIFGWLIEKNALKEAIRYL